jgi:5'-nucleotidase
MIRSIDGTKVAIISAVTASTTELSSPGNDFTFEDASVYLKNTSKMLHDQGILIIIALTHVGYEEDKKIAKDNPYIDVIVGGHSDTLLSNVQASSEGPYPTMVKTAQGHQTAIVQTAPYGTQLGELHVTFDQRGEIVSAIGEPLIVTDAITPDPVVASDVASATKKIALEASSTIATATKTIEGDPKVCRRQECEVGDLLADSLQAYGMANNAHIALINSGSIRSSINEGVIRKEDMVTALPFNEPVSIMNVTGKELEEMIDRSFAQRYDDSGAFLQLAGVRVFLSATDTQGTVCSITDTLTDAVIDSKKTYRVVTNAYLAHGGDGYTVDQAHIEEQDQNVYDVLENYLKNKQYYSKDLDGRMSATCN